MYDEGVFDKGGEGLNAVVLVISLLYTAKKERISNIVGRGKYS